MKLTILWELCGKTEEVMAAIFLFGWGERRPFYSEMEAQVERAGGGAAIAVVLRRTRPVHRERVASDPERFRSYLFESGFLAQQMATSMKIDRGALRRAFTRCAVVRWLVSGRISPLIIVDSLKCAHTRTCARKPLLFRMRAHQNSTATHLPIYYPF